MAASVLGEYASGAARALGSQWWERDDLGTPIYRLDLALPEAKFGAEYVR